MFKIFTQNEIEEGVFTNDRGQSVILDIPINLSSIDKYDLNKELKSYGLSLVYLNEGERRFMIEQKIRFDIDKKKHLSQKLQIFFHKLGHEVAEKFDMNSVGSEFDRLTYREFYTGNALNVIRKRLDPQKKFDKYEFMELIKTGEASSNSVDYKIDVAIISFLTSLNEISATAYQYYRTDYKFPEYANAYNKYFNKISKYL